MASNSQHIIRVSAEQFKNIKVVDFQLNRYITKVSGANGAGKTSALDAVFYALAGRKTLPPSLIRQGQKRGFIRIETTSHIITRKLDDKGGALQIEAKDTGNLVKAPDDWLDAIAGDLGFDPLKFMRLKPDEQFAVLKTLVPMDADIDKLEAQNQDDTETMTKRKAEMRRMEAARDHIDLDDTLPEDPIDINALLAEARSVSQHNREIEQQQREREDKQRRGEEAKRKAQARDNAIEELRERIKVLTQESRQFEMEASDLLGELERAEPLPELKDRSAIDDQISEASATNSRITANNTNRDQRERFEKDIEIIDKELDSLAASVRERKLTISQALEKARFPIPGLSFETVEEGSGGRIRAYPKKVVTYRGVPLSDASSGEQIRVSTAIGMAGKPELRFLLIREGSLLDEKGMAILEEMAHENDWQILIETVDTSGKVGVYLEDGEVKAINAEPDEDPEPEPTAPAKKTRSKPKQGKMKYGDETL